jgi:hypothetical protein
MIRNSLCNITTLLLGCQQATQVGAAEQAHHNAAAVATYRAFGGVSRTARWPRQEPRRRQRHPQY